ncbi:MAG: type I DNA topoisomerase [Coxiellaceae bacterium]|nr:type I DNA topoisomerase [Coxiellaceae bacterium]
MSESKSSLVIVESPAKAKTIKKYLGKGFQVLASYGHVRDLIPKEGAVDPANEFAMKYQAIERNQKHMDAINKAVKKVDSLLLATDPDREGEAIAWHVKEMLEDRGSLKNKDVKRVVFHQITKNAIKAAVDQPREISMDMVHAQQARRALDYLVGFNLSPLLWKKVRAGLSAGRVQSPALRMIVEREIEIEKFVSQEYWTVHAENEIEKQKFSAKLIQLDGEKVEQFTLNNETISQEAIDRIKQASNGQLEVTKVNKKQRKRNPTAPFITSTLQQEAARKLGFSTSRTMQVAQQLYEGIDTGEGATGLITYMRTDSVTLAKEAIEEIRDVIAQRYGKDKLPDEPRTYVTKSKNAQEAHEAIRPTTAATFPDAIKQHLSDEQYKLYNLIWKRTIACQMASATLDTVAVDLTAGNHVFRANGSVIVDPGFMAVYKEDVDDKKAADDSQTKILPPMNEGDKVKVNDIHGDQHFTEPPPRYTEASLVKALEEHDIGRPSTYANIIATLKHRKYVDMDNKRFKATDVGRVVSRFLTNYFNEIVDYDFTANLENQLDEIARGEAGWVPILAHFWQPFKDQVDDTDKNVQRSDVTQEKMDEACPTCGKPLSIRLGRRGRFIGCTAYPDCDYTRNLNDDGDDTTAEVVEGRECPECKNDLVVKHGKYGKFIGCSNYPNCKHMEPLEKPTDTGVQCPKCKEGTIFKRKSRRGKIFYSCGRYPDCEYAIWYKPVNEPCPKCEWPILSIKVTKRKGAEKVCPQQDCSFAEPYEGELEEDD